MNEVATLFERALVAAADAGPATEPTALLSLLASRAEPIGSLIDPDECDSAWNALVSEFPSYWHFDRPDAQVSDASIERLAGLIRWFFQEMQTTPKGKDSPLRLACLLLVAKFCAPNGALWEVADLSKVSSALITKLERLLTSLRSNFAERGHLKAPIHELEAVEALEAAERTRDWVALLARWPVFDHVLTPSLVLDQAVKALAALAPDVLIAATAKVDQFTTAVSILRALPDLNIAASSENHLIQFALIHLAGSREDCWKPITGVTESRLAELLAKVAQDQPRWAAWMGAFNRYPIRYPNLQAALGKALSELSNPALAAYIDSIELHAWAGHSGREHVDEALRAFQLSASLAQRRCLWTLAFRRWRTWDFGHNERESGLTGLGVSELDYALVGYALECLDEAGRQALVDEALVRIASTETAWFSDITAYRQAWLRAVSSLQPFAHAQTVADTNGDWLRIVRYLPFRPGHDRYSAIKTGWGHERD